MDILLELTNLLSLKAFHRKLVLRVGLLYDMLPLLSHSRQIPSPPPLALQEPLRIEDNSRTPFRGFNIPDFRPLVSMSQFRYCILSTCFPFYLNPKDKQCTSSLKEDHAYFVPYIYNSQSFSFSTIDILCSYFLHHVPHTCRQGPFITAGIPP
jgi:hypothetical protein